MLNDILDLCIEKSDGRYFYRFKYSGFTRMLTISKWERLGSSNILVWSHDYFDGDFGSALELMENE